MSEIKKIYEPININVFDQFYKFLDTPIGNAYIDRRDSIIEQQKLLQKDVNEYNKLFEASKKVESDIIRLNMIIRGFNQGNSIPSNTDIIINNTNNNINELNKLV